MSLLISEKINFEGKKKHTKWNPKKSKKKKKLQDPRWVHRKTLCLPPPTDTPNLYLHIEQFLLRNNWGLMNSFWTNNKGTTLRSIGETETRWQWLTTPDTCSREKYHWGAHTQALPPRGTAKIQQFKGQLDYLWRKSIH